MQALPIHCVPWGQAMAGDQTPQSLVSFRHCWTPSGEQRVSPGVQASSQALMHRPSTQVPLTQERGTLHSPRVEQTWVVRSPWQRRWPGIQLPPTWGSTLGAAVPDVPVEPVTPGWVLAGIAPVDVPDGMGPPVVDPP